MLMASESNSRHSDLDHLDRSRRSSKGQQPRQRRRQSSTSAPPKHRRTRSGCYTCRQRRVKCDEAQPICERCRKGKRECTYPQSATSRSTNATTVASSRQSHNEVPGKGTSSDGLSSPSVYNDGWDEHSNGLLSPIHDEHEHWMAKSFPPGGFVAGSNVTTPPVNAFASGKQSKTEKASHQRSSTSKSPKDDALLRHEKWQRLPKEMDACLRYHRDHLTYHHYAFKCDRTDFLKTTFLEIALNDDNSALLYAIVAFAAYHHSIHCERDSWQTFLTYYNKAIEALSKDLARARKHNTATLLAILQLATIEEFLGDWVHLHYHQRAAYQILTEIYRADTIMQDETRRKIIMWFSRFDLFCGVLSGGPPYLGREWYSTCARFYRTQASKHPEDMAMAIEDFFATNRLLATDMTLLFAARKAGTINEAQFSRDVKTLLHDLDAFGRRLENAFSDKACFADASEISPIAPDDIGIVNYREARWLYRGDYFIMNFVRLDFWALHLVFDYQLGLVHGRPTSPKLLEIALQKCKIIEGILHLKDRPSGALLGCQASLAAVSLFVGTTRERIEWCKRRFAMVESEGYIYPAKVHEQVARLWGEDVSYWWMPDRMDLTHNVQMIKDFVEFRRGVPKDVRLTSLSDMNGIFQSLDTSEINETHTGAVRPRIDSAYAHLPPRATWNHQGQPVTTSG